MRPFRVQHATSTILHATYSINRMRHSTHTTRRSPCCMRHTTSSMQHSPSSSTLRRMSRHAARHYSRVGCHGCSSVRFGGCSRHRFANGEEVELSSDDPHDVACLFKRALRRMTHAIPAPRLTPNQCTSHMHERTHARARALDHACTYARTQSTCRPAHICTTLSTISVLGTVIEECHLDRRPHRLQHDATSCSAVKCAHRPPRCYPSLSLLTALPSCPYQHLRRASAGACRRCMRL